MSPCPFQSRAEGRERAEGICPLLDGGLRRLIDGYSGSELILIRGTRISAQAISFVAPSFATGTDAATVPGHGSLATTSAS
jgi:hypothetical protein